MTREITTDSFPTMPSLPETPPTALEQAPSSPADASGETPAASHEFEGRYGSGALTVGLALGSLALIALSILLVGSSFGETLGRGLSRFLILACASTSLVSVVAELRGVKLRVRRVGEELHTRFGKLSLADVEKGAFAPGKERRSLQLSFKRKRTLTLAMPSDAAARELLAQAGVSQDQQRLELPLSKPSSKLLAMMISLLVALPVAGYLTAAGVWALATLLPTFDGSLEPRAFWSVLVGASLFWVVLSAGIMRLVEKVTAAPDLTVGDDAVTIRGFRQDRDIPLSAIRRARVERRGLAIDLLDGSCVRVRLGLTGDATKLAAAAAGIAYAQKRRTEPRGEERLPVTYLRGGRGVRDWHSDLRRRLVEGRGEYRQAQAPSDVFRGVIERPDPDREELLGAALGLRIAEPEEASDKLRVAARRIASPELRAALLAIAEGEEAEAEAAVEVALKGAVSATRLR